MKTGFLFCVLIFGTQESKQNWILKHFFPFGKDVYYVSYTSLLLVYTGTYIYDIYIYIITEAVVCSMVGWLSLWHIHHFLSQFYIYYRSLATNESDSQSHLKSEL